MVVVHREGRGSGRGRGGLQSNCSNGVRGDCRLMQGLAKLTEGLAKLVLGLGKIIEGLVRLESPLSPPGLDRE